MMNRLFGAFILLLPALPGLHAEESSEFALVRSATAPAIEDPSKLLDVDQRWLDAWESKLAAFEKASGISIHVRFHPKSPSEAEDKVPGAFMKALATQLKLEKRGVLVVYFADEDDWRVWVGDDLTPIFVGRPGSAAEFTESGAMHDAKEAFLKSAEEKAKAGLSQSDAKSATSVSQKAEERKLHTEAILDGLMEKLARK